MKDVPERASPVVIVHTGPQREPRVMAFAQAARGLSWLPVWLPAANDDEESASVPGGAA